MAFRSDEILSTFAEETSREHLQDAYDRAGVSGIKFQRYTFRQAPEFALNDWQLRLAIAQTCYRRHGKGHWQRCPEQYLIDTTALTALTVEHLAEAAETQPRLLTKFALTKDYVAVVSACAYLRWRMGYTQRQVAEHLDISEQQFRDILDRLRRNAARLGMSLKRRTTFQGRKPLTKQELSAVMKKSLNTPEYRAKRSELAKAQNLRQFLKTVAWG
jgi:hypothetical protein